MPVEPSEPSADLVGLANPPSLGEAPPQPASTPSQNVTVNLIRKLVGKGILDAAEANEMIRQAEAEAESARLANEAAAPANDDVRVAYVPEVVKAQIRDEIKDQVLAVIQPCGIAAHRLPCCLHESHRAAGREKRARVNVVEQGQHGGGHGRLEDALYIGRKEARHGERKLRLPLRDPRYRRPVMTVDTVKGVLDLSEDEVAEAVLECIEKRAVEIAVPARSGTIATAAYVLPSLAERIRPMLEKRGAKAKKKYIAMKRAKG